MDFGRLTDDEDLNDYKIGLPAIHGLENPVNQTRLHLGTPLWGSDFFKGTLYPKDTRKADYLRAYAELFDCLELNTSYHSIQSDETIASWVEAVSQNSNFKFYPKVPKIISHEGRLDHHFEKLQMFIASVKGFGPHLGTCFLQLPPSFTPSRIHELAGFLEFWPADMKLAVEVRHLVWFKNLEVRETFKSLLKKHDVSWVITDTPGLPDLIHQDFTTPEVMVRFVTTGFHPKDLERMQEWSGSFAKYSENGVKDILFFVHERDEWLVRSIMEKMVELNHQHLAMRPLPPYQEETHQLSLF